MQPKPAHLGPIYAEQFKDSSVVERYHYRPPYPAEAINMLISLITDAPCRVLDVGCGTGDLARRLVHKVKKIDAVDFSPMMLARGKKLPDGDDPRLNWIDGRIEEVPLHPPYALITAGESLHWMEWETVLPLFRRMLTPNGYLAIVERVFEPCPWDAAMFELIRRFSTNKDYAPYNLVNELEQRHLFQKRGALYTQPIPFVQSGEEYIQSMHSRNGLSYQRMDEQAARAFDEALLALIAPFLQDNILTQSIVSELTWGIPL
jgi:ubiquinone/menaquinone biosynthesis C-methylase UbiE